MRTEKVTVKALNENGNEIILTATGALAKCFCHEIDHLEGILFNSIYRIMLSIKKCTKSTYLIKCIL